MSQDSGEKTEQATPKKLRDARKKGQVPTSKDIPSALILVFTAVYFWLKWDEMYTSARELFLSMAEMAGTDFGQAINAGMNLAIEKGVKEIVLPFAVIVVLAGIIGNVIQFGFVFSVDPIIPKGSRINPVEGIKRIFSMKQMVQALLSLMKTIVIALATYYVAHTGIKELLNDIDQCSVLCEKEIIETMVGKLFFLIIPLIITMAIIDFIFQRFQFMKDQRMTKEELKREFKEMFGDPHVAGARRGIRRELAENDIRNKIKTARLVIVDIGTTIALHFEQGVTPLPLIVAIGRAQMARKMVEIAQVEGVPMLQDARLAKLLVEEGKIDQYIPSSSIDQVAQAMRKKPKK